MTKQNFIMLSMVTFSLFLSACANTDPNIAMTPPPYVEQMPNKETGLDVNYAGSIFGRGDNPLFSDKKAMSVNDIVTVIIQENANQSSKTSKSTKRDSTIGLGGGKFTGPQNTKIGKLANKLNNYTDIGFSGGSEAGFSGSGSTSRAETFTTTIAARIIKVLSNGNYFIEGSKEILLNNEKQIMQITGVIRPYDINQNNEINSRNVSDAKIMYITQGDLHKSTSKPWGTKVVETIWPF